MRAEKFRIATGMAAFANPQDTLLHNVWGFVNGVHLREQANLPQSYMWVDNNIQEWPREWDRDGDSYIQRISFPYPGATKGQAQEFIEHVYGVHEPHHCSVLDAGGDCCGHWITSWAEVWGGDDGDWHGIVRVSQNV